MCRSLAWFVVGGCLCASCAAPVSEEEAERGRTAGSTGPTPLASEQRDAPSSDRNAYFGDLHVHTKFSQDAFLFGTREDPDAAYEFAKGNTITHPAGFDLQLDRPLDFLAVADHAEYLGHAAAESLGEDDGEVESGRPADGRSWLWSPELDMDVVRSAWSEIVSSANRHNDPGTFTAFIGYEYSSGGGSGDNLHRNVVFRGDRGPEAPFSRLDSSNPEDLWSTMDRWRAAGMEAIAIPHNMNGSDGRMFEYEYFEGGAIDEPYVQQRTLNEPIAEITQIKGTSETHPALSPNDEWADFEVMAFKIGNWRIPSKPAGSYVRDALRRGLAIEAGGAGNPYKLGFIGSSDSHVGGGGFREDDYTGPSGLLSATAEQRASVPAVGERLQRLVASDVQTIDDGSGRTYPPGAKIQRLGAGRRVGRGEHARESLRCDAPEGDVRYVGPENPHSVLCRLGNPCARYERPDTRQRGLRAGRAHGRRPARRGHRCCSRVPGVGGAGSVEGTSTARAGGQRLDGGRRNPRASVRRRLF